MRPPSPVLGLALLGLALLSPFAAEAQGPWKRWEAAITTSRNYTTGGGNPYRDLTLRVQFTQAATGATFTQDAFWEGAAAPKTFKVRSAFPAGTWSWRVVSCQGSTGSPAQDCATDSSWSPASGSVVISTPAAATGIRLYDRGFLTQAKSLTASGTVVTAYSHILYGDLVTPFYWAADTAWAAPPREIKGTAPTAWSSFLTDRKAKGFTAVLAAPAPAWQPKAGESWPALPPAAGFSFDQSGSCSQPIPNDCSMPRPGYWQAFDNLVQQANDKDLVVVIAGLLDPVDLGSDSTSNPSPYPNQPNAVDFARYLAARMAGNHVIFSPGFDDKVTSKTQAGGSVLNVMNAVGGAIRAAAPRQQVTNHLAGAGTCTDYASFKAAGWMSFYLFHSGHAFNPSGTAGQSCPGWLGTATETRIGAVMRRAWQMPWTLSGYSGPAMPAINGEGPYDKLPITTDPVDNRYRVRQAGHLSSLSNSRGFTYGVTNMGVWHEPGTYFQADSSKDMKQLFIRFKDRLNLKYHHEWILNNATADDSRMVLASDSSSLVLAYLPGSSPGQITINTGALPGLSCTGTSWTRRWLSPTNNTPDTKRYTCTDGPSKITIGRPEGLCVSPDCDLVLELQRTGSGLASGTSLAATLDTLELWADLSPEDGTSAIRGTLSSPAAEPKDILISAAGVAFQQSPRAARLGDGYLVVWHAEGLDGSLYGVFGQRLDRDGQFLGPRFQVNTYPDHDQKDPAIASDAAGNAVVVWSSYGQDGDLGGIFGQRFVSSGKPAGDEFAVNSSIEGHQAQPQVASDAAGSFVVAWTTEEGEEVPRSVRVRRFDSLGKVTGEELTMEGSEAEGARLVDLRVSPLGDFSVRWEAHDSDGNGQGQYEQGFDSSGQRLGATLEVPE